MSELIRHDYTQLKVFRTNNKRSLLTDIKEMWTNEIDRSVEDEASMQETGQIASGKLQSKNKTGLGS